MSGEEAVFPKGGVSSWALRQEALPKWPVFSASKRGLGLLPFVLWACNKGWIWVSSGTEHSWVKEEPDPGPAVRASEKGSRWGTGFTHSAPVSIQAT